MIHTLRQAATIAWGEADSFVKRRLALTLVLVFGTAVLAALAPLALKYAVDGLRAGYDAGGAAAPTSAQSQPLTWGPAALILVYVTSLWLSRSLGEVRWYFYGTADQRLHRRLSRQLLNHIIDLPMAFHADRKTGALNQTLAQGLSGYRILTNHAVFTVLPVTLEILMVGAVLVFFFELEFLAILGVSVIAYVATFALGAARIVGPIREVSTSQVAATANMTDSILNAETVKCFNAEHQISDRYDDALALSERWWSVFYWRKSENGLLIAFIFALSLGAAMILGVVRVRQGALSVGDFVLVNAYMLQIVRPLETLGLAIRDIAHGAAFIEKMMEVMGRKPEGAAMRVIEGDASTELGSGRLEVQKVSFSYIPGRQILHDINFAIESGKTLGIVGQSGAGKSSLMRLLIRFYEPTSGDIFLNGKPIREISLKELRRAIAIVPQDTVLFNDTIAYNIGFGRLGADEAEIERAASLARIHKRIMTMPEGYRTIVGERGLKLSGGEKQRMSIARAILKRPQMFIFDEATSSLDIKTEQAVLDNLIEISRDMTTLIISHRLSTVAHADEILVLDEGRVVERGTHNKLLEINGVYDAMWRTQHHQNTEDPQTFKETA